LPPEFVVMVKRNAALLIGLNIAVAVFVPGIDIAAHVGGLVAGVGLGYLISRLAERPVATPAEAKRVRVRALLAAGAATIAILVAGALGLPRWDDPSAALSQVRTRALAIETAYVETEGDVAKRIELLEQQAIPAMHECVAELAVPKRVPKRARQQIDMWTRYCDLAGQARASELEWLRNGDKAARARAVELYVEAMNALEPEG
jgi:hypothetical protein